ncbi:MAG: trypsin-like peptidase domain-containing protein [Lentisphaeria bacterium]
MLAFSPIQTNVRPPRLLSVAALLLGLAAAVPPAPAAVPPDGSARRTAITDAVQRVMPCVVNISTERLVQVADPFGQYFDEYFRSHGKVVREAIPLGSGVIVDPAGLVVTNYHVVQRASKVLVHPSTGRPRSATLVAADPVNDLALLRLEPAGGAPLDAVGFAVPDDLLLGETVVAVGSPFGLENSVAVGVLSARNRSFQAGDRTFNDILQTDAAINPGNSGGPLVNADGQLIGINLAIRLNAEGIGFAIPLRRIEEVLAGWLTPATFSQGWLGFTPQTQTNGHGGMRAGVGAVDSGSPAAEAGLKPGDTITAVNGQPVTRGLDVGRRLWNLKAGDRFTLTLAPASDTTAPRLLSLTVAPLAGPPLIRQRFGIQVQELTPALLRAMRLPADLRGLAISDVLSSSPLAEAGARRGDLILTVDDREMTTPAQLAEWAAPRPPGTVVRVGVVAVESRGGQRLLSQSLVTVPLR